MESEEKTSPVTMVMLGFVLAPVAGAVLGAPMIGITLVTLAVLDSFLIFFNY
jgi:hypothetical protein